jgi:hypothetical protein
LRELSGNRLGAALADCSKGKMVVRADARAGDSDFEGRSGGGIAGRAVKGPQEP